MATLLHISASPRGAASESIQIAHAFIESYCGVHPDAVVETWDLWDGTLPEFGAAAAGAKMTVFSGGVHRPSRPLRGARRRNVPPLRRRGPAAV